MAKFLILRDCNRYILWPDRNGESFNIAFVDPAKANAATISVIYLILVIHFSMYMLREELPPISNMLLNNFTAIVGVVVAFYFGSSAYVEGRRKQNMGKEEEE